MTCHWVQLYSHWKGSCLTCIREGRGLTWGAAIYLVPWHFTLQCVAYNPILQIHKYKQWYHHQKQRPEITKLETSTSYQQILFFNRIMWGRSCPSVSLYMFFILILKGTLEMLLTACLIQIQYIGHFPDLSA